MRKIVLALAAVAAFGLTVPVVSAPADAKTQVVVIKKKNHWNRGHHYGWSKQRHHNRYHGYHHGHRNGATVVVR
jgi:hypothetical protein